MSPGNSSPAPPQALGCAAKGFCLLETPGSGVLPRLTGWGSPGSSRIETGTKAVVAISALLIPAWPCCCSNSDHLCLCFLLTVCGAFHQAASDTAVSFLKLRGLFPFFSWDIYLQRSPIPFYNSPWAPSRSEHFVVCSALSSVLNATSHPKPGYQEEMATEISS